jgi:hypothetical protein
MSEIPTSMGWEASLKVKGRRKIHVVSGTIEWAIARLHAEMLARG